MSEITQRVDRIFTTWDRPDSPGCALAVIRDGEIVYKRGYGMANLEHNVPIGPQTIFDIGSTSKQFTALCILLLARRGKLSLDDPIQRFLPEMPEYEQPITISHLIHHTSGLRDYLTLMALANMPFENDYQEPEVVALIARQQALNFAPGAEFLYSNSGYFLLSEIVERVSGQNLRDFAQENVFGPLGMVHTHFHNNFKEIVPHRASGYAPRKEGGYQIDMGIFDVLGDGAVYTSVEDLYLWDQNYYDNRLDGGGQELIRQMEELGVLNSGEKLDYAFGLTLTDYRGLHSVHHGGSWYGYRAEMLRFPEQRFSVICLSNLGSMDPSSLCLQVADVYLESVFTQAPSHGGGEENGPVASLSEKALQEKTGTFQDAESGTMATLTVQSGEMLLNTMGMEFVMQPLDADSFKALDAPVKLIVTYETDPDHVTVDVNDGMQTMHFERIQPPQLSAQQLAEYAGAYHSEELGITYHLSAGDNLLRAEPASPYFDTLHPSQPDAFSAGMASIQFLRGDEGKVIGYTVNAGRVKNIRFDRVE